MIQVVQVGPEHQRPAGGRKLYSVQEGSQECFDVGYVLFGEIEFSTGVNDVGIPCLGIDVGEVFALNTWGVQGASPCGVGTVTPLAAIEHAIALSVQQRSVGGVSDGGLIHATGCPRENDTHGGYVSKASSSD